MAVITGSIYNMNGKNDAKCHEMRTNTKDNTKKEETKVFSLFPLWSLIIVA